MGKLDKIKKHLADGTANSKMLEYTLWYIESLEKEALYLRQIKPKDETEAYIRNNFPNWISHRRASVDDGQMSESEYRDWLKTAEENEKFVTMAGKKVPKYPSDR